MTREDLIPRSRHVVGSCWVGMKRMITLAAVVLMSGIFCGVMLSPAFAADENSDESAQFKFPTAKDYPKLPANGSRPESFVAKKWHVIGKAQGDLNGDKLPDLALAIQADYPAFLQEHKFLGENPFNANPRRLIILFKKPAGGYSLAAFNNYLIGMPEVATMDQPFQALTIKNGVVTVTNQIFLSAGGWGMSTIDYKFRYDGKDFVMIGGDVLEHNRASGEETTKSCNFLTRKIRSSIPVETNGTYKVTWQKISTKKGIPKLADFKHLNDWQTFLDHY